MKTKIKNRKILLVYYSRSGNTKKVANAISSLIDCDVEEIVRKEEMNGLVGYGQKLFESWFGVAPEIELTYKDPSQYDLVLLGSPVWGNRVASPMRTYLIRNSGEFKQTAFFVTCHGEINRETFRQMESLTESHPTGLLTVKTPDLENGSYLRKLKDFITKIQVAAVAWEQHQMKEQFEVDSKKDPKHSHQSEETWVHDDQRDKIEVQAENFKATA